MFWIGFVCGTFFGVIAFIVLALAIGGTDDDDEL